MPKRTDINKVLIIGSGPIIIGQACEFDYSGTQACKALRNLGYEIVLVNSNPATIMTDPETADVTYIEPLNVERLEQIIAKERPDALLPNLGGQSALNLCSELNQAGVLEKYNVQVIGVQVDAIERGEDRVEFKKAMDELGIEMARSEVAYTVDEALAIADKLGYPVVLRPAYTMGGVGGGLVYNKEELKADENITVNYKLKFSAEDKVNSVSFYMFLEKIDDNYEVIDEPCKLNVISRNGNAINIDDDSYSVEDSIFEYKIKKDFSIAGVDETFVVSISEPGMYELTLGAEASSSDESLWGNSMEQFHIIKLEE